MMVPSGVEALLTSNTPCDGEATIMNNVIDLESMDRRLTVSLHPAGRGFTLNDIQMIYGSYGLIGRRNPYHYHVHFLHYTLI